LRDTAQIAPGPETASSESLCVQAALRGRSFATTPMLRKLLIYLWEHRGEDANEYAIAVDALDRRPDFDPRIDATVRVQISRLRVRLKEFYETEGNELPLQMTVPLGTHRLQFIEANHGELPEGQPSMGFAVTAKARPAARAGRFSTRMVVTVAVVVLVATVIGSTVWWVLHTRRLARPQIGQMPAFWNQCLGNGKETRIVIPAPVFFAWKSASGDRLMVRDPEVNDYATEKKSKALSGLEDKLGKSELMQAYTVAPDTYAATQLVHYLDQYGVPVVVSETSDSPIGELDRSNFVVIGTGRTLSPFQPYLNRLDLKMDTRKESVEDVKAQAGKPTVYNTEHQSIQRAVTPGILAMLPSNGSGGRIMVIMSPYDTFAMVAYLTSQAGLRDLERAQRAAGKNPYFEAVIMSETDGSVPLRSSLVLYRPLPPTP